MSRVMLLQPVNIQLVDQEHVWREVALGVGLQALVGQLREQFLQHGGGVRVAEAKVFLGTNEQKRPGGMALPGARVAYWTTVKGVTESLRHRGDVKEILHSRALLYDIAPVAMAERL